MLCVTRAADLSQCVCGSRMLSVFPQPMQGWKGEMESSRYVGLIVGERVTNTLQPAVSTGVGACTMLLLGDTFHSTGSDDVGARISDSS